MMALTSSLGIPVRRRKRPRSVDVAKVLRSGLELKETEGGVKKRKIKEINNRR